MMETKTLLKDVSALAELWRNKKVESKVLRRQWETYIFFAQTKEGYTDFMVEVLSNGVKYSSFGRPRYHAEYAHMDRLSFDEGSALIQRLRATESEHNEAGILLSRYMRRLWDADVPLPDIAEAYGQSVNATYQYIRRQSWYQNRYKTRQGA